VLVTDKNSANVFRDTPPSQWLGPHRNAFCVDFCVGKRFTERKHGTGPGQFKGTLGALRVPARPDEPWQVVFEDRDPWILRPPGPDPQAAIDA
jgi:hypothetical protein